MTKYMNDPNDPMNAVDLRDHADVFILADQYPKNPIKVTIDRGWDRDRISKVYTPTKASLARITRLLNEYYWPTAGVMTHNGWLGYSSRG